MTATLKAMAEAKYSLDDAVSHFAAFRTQDNRDVVDQCLDVLIEAVRADEREKVLDEVAQDNAGEAL